MAITKYSDISSYVANIYEDALFVARESNIMTGLVYNYSATGWMTRTVPLYAQVTAQTKAEGVDFNNPTTFSKSTAATLTPAMIMAQVLLTDEDMDTDPDDAQRSASMELGMAIATKIDVDLAGDFSSFDSDVGPGAATSADINSCAVAMSVLRNVPVPNPINVVLHPYHWHDCWIELGQPGTDSFLGDVANQALRDFYVGAWMGMRWFTSANIAVDGDDDAVSGVFNTQALAFDSRKPPTLETERDTSKLATELNMSAGYAHGVRRSNFGVYYTADATTPT